MDQFIKHSLVVQDTAASLVSHRSHHSCGPLHRNHPVIVGRWLERHILRHHHLGLRSQISPQIWCVVTHRGSESCWGHWNILRNIVNNLGNLLNFGLRLGRLNGFWLWRRYCLRRGCWGRIRLGIDFERKRSI